MKRAALVYSLFYLSGCAALVYEIAWSRMLGLLFGHTVYAAAVVLAAYFAGMALGNLLASRWAPRMARPLIGYGVAEIVVALWALATPLLIGLFSSPALSPLLNHPQPGLQLGLRSAAAFLLLFPATLALGATLPFIAQHVSPPSAPRPAAISLAYALNTAGAFSGVLLATFVLILWLGVSGSGNLAAALSAFCGIAAIIIAMRGAPAETLPPANAATVASATDNSGERLQVNWWFVLAALSGFGTLALQVLYTRMFALTFHNSTYTFGGVVAVFLVALAAGSWLVSRYGQQLNPQRSAAMACYCGGLLVILSITLFKSYTRLGYFKLDSDMLESVGLASLGSSFAAYIIGAMLLIVMIVFLPTMLLGTLLPLAFNAMPQSARVGRLSAVNTICATLGALCASFALLPLLGLWRSFLLLATMYVLLGLALAVRSSGWRGAVPVLMALPVLLACWLVISAWPTAIVRKSQTLVYAKETPYGLISVVQDSRNGDLILKQNNHYTLGSRLSDKGEQRQGLVPLLLHPHPREVCFLGLATGSTADSALLAPEVEQLTTVELIPQVVEAARFFELPGGVLESPRSEIVVNDARHYLYATDRQFDVIVSDLFVPWHSQTGYLYTKEHYEAARARLKPGGLFCQWLPFYQVGEREFRLIADSFASVFPCTTIWIDDLTGSSPIVAFVGSEEPLVLDGPQLQQRFAALPPDVRASRDFRDSMSLLRRYNGDWQYRAGSLLNTDDHPRVEFLAPISQPEKELLSGLRLMTFRRDVLGRLPMELVEYTPRAGEPLPDFPLLRRQMLEE